MSAAPASVRPEATIALLPPGGVPSPAVLEARARKNERIRRVFTAAYFAAMGLPPAAVLVGPASGDDWPVAVMILCYGLVTPIAGLVVFCFAVARWKAREMRALWGAVLALMASTAILPRAGRMGTEAALDRNAAELEAIVAEIRRGGPEMANAISGSPSLPRYQDPPEEVVVAAQRLWERAEALGFSSIAVRGSHVLFRNDAPFTPDLLYRTGTAALDMRYDCAPGEPRYAGGAWYLLECSQEVEM